MSHLLNATLSKVEANSKILFIWSGQDIPVDFQKVIEKLQSKCGNEEKIAVEHADRLSFANYNQSTFDCIISNLLTPVFAANTSEGLANYLRLLKPKGFLVVFGKETALSSLESELKLSGYQNLHTESENSIACVFAEKPNFEVGVTRKLKFASKVQQAEEAKKVSEKVWLFSVNDIQEDDLINTDDLLDDKDILKPVASTQFDCGTSKEAKKKACKNCTCGLAEEIENEAAGQQKKNVESANFKSACGSCYLGDAFRCASCPYLGMPAFKPGEKVQLKEFGKADI